MKTQVVIIHISAKKDWLSFSVSNQVLSTISDRFNQV